MLPHRMLHLLMLMALLCGADAYCPTLVLDPPEVIAEFGSSVSVNCTSSSGAHEGMYWSNETSAMSAMTEDEEFILIQLSAWNVMAKCIIKINASLECSEDLKITLYKNPEVTLFSLMEPVVETELVLQCNILDAAPVQNLTVKWYKDNVMIKTDSFLNTSTTPVSESSLLYVNVSRRDNRAEFRCEAQLDFGPNGPKPPPISETKVISVHYAPEFSNNILDVYLTEGDDVTLSCDAEGYPPPTFQWTCDGVNMMEKTKNLNVTQANVSTNCTCTASNSLGRTNKYIFIHVIKDVMRAPAEAVTTAVPPKGCPLTLTPDEVVVRFGDRASVNCTTSDPDAYGMGWEASVGGTQLGNPPSVVWTVEELHAWAIKPKCYITFMDNKQCYKESNITLYKTPDAVSVSAVSEGPMVEGVPYQLRCDITSVAPAGNLKVTWSMGEKNYSEEMFNDTSATPVNKTSLLTVTPKRGHNVTLFRCKAELHLGPKGPETVPTMSSKPYPAVVHYKPMMKDCPTTFTGVEHQFRLEMLPCKADGNPPPTVQWYYEGKPVNTSEPLSRIHSGKYTAALLNELSSTNTSVNITIEYGPSFTGDGRYEVRENGKARMDFKLEGIPAPNITWFKDGEVVVPPDHWTRHHSGKYLLRATNLHGTANHTLDLDVLYKPMMKDCPTTFTGVEHHFRLEMLPCKADGNPPPTVHWYYEGKLVNTSEPLSRAHSGKYTAVLLNELSSTNTSVDIIIQYAPEFSNNTLDVYLTEGDDVTLSCDAEGYPPPTFQWTRDGVNMMEKTKNLNVTQANVSTNYTCTASNSLGRTNKSIFIHLIKDVMRAPAEAVTTAVPRKGCPLTLTPDEVVVRFGDRASVNCTTSDPDAYGMGWEASVGGTQLGNPPSVLWTVEELQAWAIKPKCYITFMDNQQCYKESNITLYKTPDAVSVSAVSEGPMVEGVPYQLRCDITSVAPAGNLKVTWSMGEKNYSEEMFNDTSATPVNKTSLLTVTPKRGHNVTLFRCKAELHLGPKGPETVPTMSSKPYTAVVHYKPMMKDCPTTFTGVEHQFRLEMLPCKADGNPPPTVQWYYEGKPVNTSEPLSRIHSGKYTAALLNELSSTNTSVNITIEYGPSFTGDGRYEVRENGKARMDFKLEGIPAPSITWFKDGEVVVPPDHWTRHHSGKYLLRATNLHGTANHTLDLDVLYKPMMKDCPTTFTGVEHHFRLEMLPCKADGNPPPTVHWYYKGKLVNTSEPLSRAHSGKYTAVLLNELSSTNTSVDITIEYAPEFSNNTLDVYLTEGDDVTLSCDAEGYPPPTFQWTRDGVNMMEKTKNLNVTQANVSTNYTCTASNSLGRTNKSIFIHLIKDVMRAPAEAVTTAVPPKGCPLTLTPDEVVVRFGDRASVNCTTSDPDAYGMGWEASVGGTQLGNPPSVVWTVEKLHAWAIKPKCYITLMDNQQCYKESNITLYKTPDAVSISAVSEGPMVEGVPYHLRCDITSVAPAGNLKVTWSMGEKNYSEEMFNDTSATPVNKTSLLTVNATRGHNGTLFRCKAELHLGPKGPDTVPTMSSKPYPAVVHFAPEFRKGNYSQEVTLGQDVTFACSAEGNPIPEIQWNFSAAENVRETTGGRQKNVTVTGATSTNAGVYICVATNKVGSVSRSVTLRMKGRMSQDRSFWWLIIPCLLILLLIVVITLCKRRKKHGQYSFIPPAKEGSEIPLTTTSGGDKA